MPALQSPWFIPHVIVYILSYAILAFSSIVAAYGLYKVYTNTFETATIKLADNLVYLGFSFLTMGLLFGCPLGKRSMGSLLDLGSQGDMGIPDMAQLPSLFTFPDFSAL